jgi:hypothetical protein
MKQLIMNDTVMPYVVAAPEDDIITNLYKWLDGIIFKNKTIISDLSIVPNKRPAADIADTLIPFLLGCKVESGVEFGLAWWS